MLKRCRCVWHRGQQHSNKHHCCALTCIVCPTSADDITNTFRTNITILHGQMQSKTTCISHKLFEFLPHYASKGLVQNANVPPIAILHFLSVVTFNDLNIHLQMPVINWIKKNIKKTIESKFHVPYTSILFVQAVDPRLYSHSRLQLI